jgi:3-oxoacyl-[acyl-carrier-protein] synthase II
MSKQKRIVITGMGLVSCFGSDLKEFHQKLSNGESGVELISRYECDDLSTRFGALINDFDPSGYVDKKQARRVDPYINYTLVAGKRAVEDAKLDTVLDTLDKDRCGVLIGTGMGGMDMFAQGVKCLIDEKRISPFFVPYIITNMGGALLAMDLGFMGPNYSISTACATGNHCIIAAANHILQGDADVMICGGSEAAASKVGLAGFCACKALSQRNDDPKAASRPFDQARDGFVMGEGSGVLVLETLEHALARGAPIYAEYLGGAVNCDAHHITNPREDGKGIGNCVKLALKKANLQPEDVNYINAHATATPLGDLAEVNAMKRVFDKPEKIAMNSTKSMIGHCLGGAGGVEAIATIKQIEHQVVHPTINLENPEPNLGFNIPTQVEDCKINVALSNSFGFGGHNASIVFAKHNS